MKLDIALTIPFSIEWNMLNTTIINQPCSINLFKFSTTVIHNLENYSYLFNLRPNIYTSWCLNSHFTPNNSGLIEGEMNHMALPTRYMIRNSSEADFYLWNHYTSASRSMSSLLVMQYAFTQQYILVSAVLFALHGRMICWWSPGGTVVLICKWIRRRLDQSCSIWSTQFTQWNHQMSQRSFQIPSERNTLNYVLYPLYTTFGQHSPCIRSMRCGRWEVIHTL